MSYANGRQTGERSASYIMRRCEAIRESYRAGHITISEAHVSICAYLYVAETCTIDTMLPLSWLLKK